MDLLRRRGGGLRGKAAGRAREWLRARGSCRARCARRASMAGGSSSMARRRSRGGARQVLGGAQLERDGAADRIGCPSRPRRRRCLRCVRAAGATTAPAGPAGNKGRGAASLGDRASTSRSESAMAFTVRRAGDVLGSPTRRHRPAFNSRSSASWTRGRQGGGLLDQRSRRRPPRRRPGRFRRRTGRPAPPPREIADIQPHQGPAAAPSADPSREPARPCRCRARPAEEVGAEGVVLQLLDDVQDPAHRRVPGATRIRAQSSAQPPGPGPSAGCGARRMRVTPRAAHGRRRSRPPLSGAADGEAPPRVEPRSRSMVA